MIYLIRGVLAVAITVYNRYFPILGVKCYPLSQLDLHLVVASLLEKNVGIRMLNKKGYRVVGYSCVCNHDVKKRHLKIEYNC